MPTSLDLDAWNGFDKLPTFQWNKLTSTMWIVFVFAGIVTEVGINVAVLNYCWFHAPKGRPLNTMVAVDQSLTMIGNLVASGLILLSLLFNSPLADIFGPWFCNWFWLLQHFLSTNAFIAGQAMILYRFLSSRYLRFTYEFMGGNFRLMWILLAYQYTAGPFVVWISYILSQRSGKAVVNELCHGWTPEAADVFHNYHILSALLETGSDPGFWLGLRVLLLTVGILSCGLELALYGILFKGFYTHDKGMIQALGLDTVTKRTRRNAVTLCGQALNFCFFVVFTLVFVMLISDKISFINAPQYFLLLIIVTPVQSFIQLLASPELRRHLGLESKFNAVIKSI